MPQRQQPQAQSMQNVDHTSDPCVLAESHEPLAIVIRELLVIQQPDVLVEYGVEHGHVGLLGLDGVREEAVGLVGYELVDRHLLHSEYHRGAADVLLHQGTGVQVGLGRIGTTIARLDDDLDAGADQPAHVGGRHGGATLPYRLVLAPDRYHLATKTVLWVVAGDYFE